MDNIEMLHENQRIFREGYYEKDGKTISLTVSIEGASKTVVLLPEKVEKICSNPKEEVMPKYISFGSGCRFTCRNSDALFFTGKQLKIVMKDWGIDTEERPELVLNFANPVLPGGNVRNGGSGKEEDLCIRSSLLCSLESQDAVAYYEYNRKLHTRYNSHSMILTPQVEVIRDENGELLDVPFEISVLTCAAPMIAKGKGKKTEEEYRQIVFDRITAMLKCAAHYGYKDFVLGAWGCGSFGNDANVMSDLFYKAMQEFDYGGYGISAMFDSITFAVRDHSENQYTYRAFERNFMDYYRYTEQAMNKKRDRSRFQDRIRGSLLGGAAGDALGYPVEFMSENKIRSVFGEKGIQEYQLDPETGTAVISDDTQMTLFTANALLYGETRGQLRGIAGPPHGYCQMAYQDWYLTQEKSFEEAQELIKEKKYRCISWLSNIPELYQRRAPGLTCLEAVRKRMDMEYVSDPIEQPITQSKGCGSIMRIAPVGLYQRGFWKMEKDAAEIGALTHGHSLGYMPCAFLAHLLHAILEADGKRPLKEMVMESSDSTMKMFPEDPNLHILLDLVGLAVQLSENAEPDLPNIHRLGKGWVAEETLAIAIYCSLRYENDFSSGIIAAVNHGGDSDSTGAVTGNILGAMCGYDAIDRKWKSDLELFDIILEIADDLCYGCLMEEYSEYNDPEWSAKYIYHALYKS